MAPALLTAAAGGNDHVHSGESVFWRCRDGPLVAALSGSSGGGSSEQANEEEQGQARTDGAALAAFAAASRDSWLVARTVTTLRPSFLLPDAIMRR